MLAWLVAEWLECWTARALLNTGLFHEVHDSVTFQIPDWTETSEVDVVAMRGHTPFVFSCTIDDKSSMGKHKLFEVRQRANQLGGEHARAAVVCLTTSPDDLAKQLNQGWKGYGTIEAFGLPDLTDQETFQKKINDWIQKLEA